MATAVNPPGASAIPITVNISAAHDSTLSGASSSVFLTVSLQNESTKPVHLLRWSSPFDSRAGALGVFSFTSESSGEKAPGLNMKINRKLPHPAVFQLDDENIVTIRGGQKVEHKVEVAEREVQLKKGDAYLVKAVGRWMAVWLGERAELAMNDESGFMIGEYESNEVKITAPA